MSEFPKTRIRFRRGTAAQWSAADPVLASGEPGFIVDSNTLKIGDGTTTFASLSSISGGGGGGDVVDDTTPQLGGNLDINSSNIIGTGNVALTGSGTFTSIIKTGGTSSQFLKADGSVDSSTYLTDIVNDTTPSLGGELNLDNKDIVIDAKNNDGTQIDAGTPVYIVGYHAGSSKPLIAPADASDPAKMPAVGIANDDIAGSAEGTIGVMGIVDGIDTTSPVSFTIGDVVYVANGGGLTNVKPTTATHLVQNLGRVTKVNASNGRILLLGAGRVNDIPNSGTFSGNIEAASFIKNGGTSSQFLKADGSVDSSTYLTSALSNVVEDTTPQLGGNLDLNSKNITGTGSINITGSGTFAYTDGTCGLMVQDTGGSGIHIGDCALGSVDTYAGIKHSNHGTSDYMMISNGVTTFLSAVNNGAVILRGGGNDANSEIQVKDVGAGAVGIIFNEAGSDRDIRMESAGSTNMFRLDASANSIGLNTGTPSHTLAVSGDINAQNVYVSGAPATKSDTTGITGASGVANLVYISSGDYAALSSYSSSTIYFIR